MGFVAHHLIRFTREALRGEHNASFYAAKAEQREARPQSAVVAGGPAVPARPEPAGGLEDRAGGFRAARRMQAPLACDGKVARGPLAGGLLASIHRAPRYSF